jgi:elongation factor 1-beta
MSEFKNLDSAAGLKKLNDFLADNSYLSGYSPSQADNAAFNQISNLDRAAYPHVSRWFNHIAWFSAESRQGWSGDDAKCAPAKKAAAPAADDDSDDDMDFDDMLGDSDDDEETAALLAAKSDQVKAIQARQAAKAHKAKSNLTLDIKPYDAETDMNEVQNQVKSIKMEGLTWLGGSLIDVAFGVKKLRIMCQLVDVLLSPDDVREQVEDIEDVQSTDVFAFQMA